MYFVFSLLAWSVATFIILGGAPEPVAGVSFTLLYFVVFGIWGIVWIIFCEKIVRRLGLPWPHLFLLLLVGLLYGLALALMGDVPPHVTLSFVPVIIVYLIKLSRLGA